MTGIGIGARLNATGLAIRLVPNTSGLADNRHSYYDCLVMAFGQLAVSRRSGISEPLHSRHLLLNSRCNRVLLHQT
jgi:hypothetical protein